MVPNGWDCQPLSKLLEKVIDYRGQSVPKANHGVPLITARNVRDGYLDFTSQEFVSDQDFVSWMKRGIPRAGDILFTTEAPLGKACRFPEEGRFAVGQRTVTLRTNSRLDSDYLLYFILSSHGQNLIDLRSSGSTAKGIKSSELKKVKVSFPTYVPEQKKIAQILSIWDKAITTTEQLLASSQQQKKALMQQLLTGKQRLLDQNGERFQGGGKVSKTPYKQIPNDWSEVGLSEISSFITKGATPTTYGYEWQDSGIPFIRSECVGESGFKESGLAFIGDDAHKTMSRSTVFSGDILITITGNVGRVCKLPAIIPEANINQHIAKITLDANVVCPDFVYHCLQDRKYRVHFERITTGQAYPQISLVQVRDAVVPMPSLEEQHKIAAVLSAADQEITTLQQQLDHLKQEKKALMQQLLTGKRRVKLN